LLWIRQIPESQREEEDESNGGGFNSS